jgi:hypothetical protein
MATQAEFNQLLLQVAALQQENDDLKKEQNEFMEQLVNEIETIEKTQSFWKYFKYVSLVVNMIKTIKAFIEKRKLKG